MASWRSVCHEGARRKRVSRLPEYLEWNFPDDCVATNFWVAAHWRIFAAASERLRPRAMNAAGFSGGILQIASDGNAVRYPLVSQASKPNY